jgi:cytochrome d ubiquinol oxidase subunit I
LLTLSRRHWALTAAMHITFSAMTVGTSVFLVVYSWMYMRTDEELWLRMIRFRPGTFGIGFAVGGTVPTFKFGLNWGSLRLSRRPNPRRRDHDRDRHGLLP